MRADRIGVLGFSAGGEVAGRTALMFADRQYPASDDVDQVSSRPDFAILIYPAYLVDKDDPKLRSDVPVSKASPPMFLAHAFDDPVTVHSSLALATELKKSGVSAELHVFATGGHGYGIRNTNEPVNSWPARCGEWLARTGWLKK